MCTLPLDTTIPIVPLQSFQARQEARRLKKALAHVGFRTTTVKALYRQGVNRVNDLQFLDDAALDDLLDDLLSR